MIQSFSCDFSLGKKMGKLVFLSAFPDDGKAGSYSRNLLKTISLLTV